MPRIAFKMKLNPGCRDEYIRRHAAIWPQLKALLGENGISDYSIFLDEETDTLFAVQMQQETTSSQDLAAAPVMRKWWAYMADIMETNDDLSPVSAPLTEVFHMD